MSGEPVLELTDASIVKGGIRVLDGVRLTIGAGEHTAIVGPNGAGKSSLINLLTHYDRPVATEDGVPPVRVFGNARWHVFDLRPQLGIVSHDLHHRFVNGNSAGLINGENAVLSGFFASQGFLWPGSITDPMREQAAKALARMDAVHLSSKMLNEMSTGEVRRVLIARALVTTPKALVLDEPTAGLDLLARRRFLEQVSRIAQEGTTIVLVTHHVEDIIPEVQQVVLLKKGRVAVSGPKRAVLTPDNLSALFGAPVTLHEVDGYYFAHA